MIEKGEGIFALATFVEDYDLELKAMKEKGVIVEEESSISLFPGYKFRVASVAPYRNRSFWIELIDMAGLPPSL